MTEPIQVQVVLPERSEDALSEGLRSLTERIHKAGLADADKQWRASRKLVGKLPHEIAEHGTPEYEAASKEFDRRIEERNRRQRTVYPAVVHTCQPVGLMTYRPVREDNNGDEWRAPNFWHKPSGVKVWWYKWIGRDMEIHNPNAVDVDDVLRECVKSLPGKRTT